MESIKWVINEKKTFQSYVKLNWIKESVQGKMQGVYSEMLSFFMNPSCYKLDKRKCSR